MFTFKPSFKAIMLIVCTFFLLSCSEPGNSEVSKEETSPSAKPSTRKLVDNEAAAQSDKSKVQEKQNHLVIYKSPTCGCCQKWIDHLSESGLTSQAINENNMSIIKSDKGIMPRYQSCHTAISKQGYIFEGHVPAKYIVQFLAQNHQANVLGLSVPAMPVGSPGMEVGDKFMPYHILVLKTDGSAEIYEQIDNYQQQF